MTSSNDSPEPPSDSFSTPGATHPPSGVTADAQAGEPVADADLDNTVGPDADERVDEWADVATAAARVEMRRRAHARAVEIAPAVLSAVLATPRRSLPIRSRDDTENTYISERVITALLRRHIDDLPGFAVNRVRLEVDLNQTLVAVTVELIVRYNQPIAEGAHSVRAVTEQELERALGPASREVDVSVINVHVQDVTLRDPSIEQPGDL